MLWRHRLFCFAVLTATSGYLSLDMRANIVAKREKRGTMEKTAWIFHGDGKKGDAL